jgi:hypothetical protein
MTGLSSGLSRSVDSDHYFYKSDKQMPPDSNITDQFNYF